MSMTNDYTSVNALVKDSLESDILTKFFNSPLSDGQDNSSNYLSTPTNYSVGNASVYDYVYDYRDSIDTLFWSELAPPLIVYTLTYALGVIGNGLLIFTIVKYRRLKSTTNVFLASLASADLLLILLCISVKISRLFSFSWTLGYFFCKLIYYMQAVSTTCSVYTMTAMSLERYYAIVHPMRAQYRCTIGKAKAVAFIVWMLSFIFASPILRAQVHMEVGMKRMAYWCVRDFDSEHVWAAYETYNLILVLALPVIIMATAYTAILNAVFNMAASRRRMTSSFHSDGPVSARQLSEDKTVRQVVRMLVVVVLLFIACWGPILVLNVLQAYSIVPEYNIKLKHWRTALDLLSYCNSCMNPVVYGFMSKNFRKGFKRALCSMAKRDRHMSLSRSDTFMTQNARKFGNGECTANGIILYSSSRKFHGRHERPRKFLDDDYKPGHVMLEDYPTISRDISI